MPASTARPKKPSGKAAAPATNKKKSATASVSSGAKKGSLPKLGNGASAAPAAAAAAVAADRKASKRVSAPFATASAAGASTSNVSTSVRSKVTSKGTAAAKSKKSLAGSPHPPRGGRGSSVVGRGRGGARGSKAHAASQQHQLQLIVAALEGVEEDEQTTRHELEMMQESEFDGFRPVYNVLVMEMVRGQVEQVNKRQMALNAMMEAFKRDSLSGNGSAEALALKDEQQSEALVDRLRTRLESDAVAELQRVKAENTNLRRNLEETILALEKKTAEMEVMRANFARKLARSDVDSDTLRAEVQATLHASTLEVERIKRELAHRIDIACASIRTPRYKTSLEEMRELTRQAQAEVQEHHDELTKLVVSIGAQDTFLKHDGDTMHSNLPTQYRTELRKLEKDQLLNLLDVLSFQDGVVDTVGKAVYVITEAQYKTAVV